VRSLAQFSNEHGGRLVAEGVEDAATAEALIELGVELGQGWHVGWPGPLPAREDRAMLCGADWPDAGRPDGADPATGALTVHDHDAAAPVDHTGHDVASAQPRRPHRAEPSGPRRVGDGASATRRPAAGRTCNLRARTAANDVPG
jgi:hypothetical protein